jgi:hypothetical protein
MRYDNAGIFLERLGKTGKTFVSVAELRAER